MLPYLRCHLESSILVQKEWPKCNYDIHHIKVCVLETHIKKPQNPKQPQKCKGFLEHEEDKAHKTQKHLLRVS